MCIQENIAKGSFIMQYVGEVIPRAVMDGRSKQETRRGHHNYCMEAVGEERDLEYDWAAPCIDSLVSLFYILFLVFFCLLLTTFRPLV